ncbi:MAG: GtrA family protein [Candidatus Marinimicrobia bacterium]|nr:GtrA family protein [Candidatus Neomarinimicrobiota bacterium]
MKLKNIIRFQFVAWLGTFVNLGSLWLFHGQLDLPISISGALAIELAILHNFTWHYFITWNDRVHFTLSDFLKRLYKYNILTASVDFAINLSTLYSLNKFLGVHYMLAGIIGMSAGPIFKFLINEFIIFRKSIAHHHKAKN